MKNLRLLLSTLLILIFFACKRGLENPAQPKPWNEYQSWLALNGKVFSKGTIEIISNGLSNQGILSWEQGIRTTKNGIEFFIVPFTYAKSFYKGNKVLINFSNGNSTLDHLVFWKNSSGVINARWRNRAYYTGNSSSSRKMVESYYSLDGTNQSVRLWSEKAKPIFGVITSTADKSDGKITGCSQPFAVVTRSISCSTPTYQQTTCVFINTTTYYTFCIEGEGVPTAEPESLEPSDDGWYEYLSETQEFQNQHIIDSLSDSFPCAKEVLMQLPNINEKAYQILDSVFGVSPNVNIIFKDSTLWTGQRDWRVGFAGNPNLTNGFNVTVYLDRTMLVYASKDFIANVMIHEAVHAYLMYMMELRRTNVISQTDFINNFPKLYEYGFQGQAAHEEIVTNYFNHLTSILHSFNPSISNSLADAIAWHGLHKTQAWQNLGNDTNIYIPLMDTAWYGERYSQLALGLKLCP